jgi:sigma-B regulation protein RsbU (phosphoserine phosphatase)
MALAAEVQKCPLPAQPPVADVAEFAAVSLPARSIGGDCYDFIEIGENRIGIALADVSGKGVAAALIMSVVQASLRIISSDEDISLPQLAATASCITSMRATTRHISFDPGSSARLAPSITPTLKFKNFPSVGLL